MLFPALCLLLAAVLAAPTVAQELTGVVISNPSGQPLRVDGLDTQKLPTSVAAGSEVCVADTTYYKSEGERFTFQRWSNGATTPCVTLETAGNYSPVHVHEVLVHVKSAAPDHQRSHWVVYGQRTEFSVPEIARSQEDDRTRYRFQQWSDGERQFQTTNAIAPLKPTTLEVRWLKEHQVTIEAPDYVDLPMQRDGWYADGSSLILSAPDVVPADKEFERWKFARWDSVGFPVPVLQGADKAQASVKVDGPYNLKATYGKQYFVHARGPSGTLKREWLFEGQELVLETPPVIEIVKDLDQHVFKRWDGMEGLNSPKISGVVDRPVVINAVYDHQVMVKVDGPYGASGGGWQTVGSFVTISVPQTSQKLVFLKDWFVGFPGHPAGQSTVQVQVTGPMALTAAYSTWPDFVLIFFVLLFPLLAVLALFSHRWVPYLPARARARVERVLRRMPVRLQRLFWRPAVERPVAPERYDLPAAGRS